MKTLPKIAGITAATALIASPAFAEAGVEAAEHTAFILNSVLFLMGGFLVFWMAAGFTMLEAGLVRSKNVTMQLTKNIVLFALAAIAYYLIGYNVMYPLGNWSIGSDETGGYLGAFGVAILEMVGVSAENAVT